MISIAYLDGRRLSRAVIAGAYYVGERAEPLNKINVFPVPDGDTGTNLAGTLQKGHLRWKAELIGVTGKDIAGNVSSYP